MNGVATPGHRREASPATAPISAPLQAPSSAMRPTPARATTLQTTYKARAASQPAGERLPPSSNPGSGRGSPGMNGNEYGVIGGSRTPGRFGSALAAHSAPGTQTRANSFSVADGRDFSHSTILRTLSSHTEEIPTSRSRSTSPYPTFSPTSSASNSPQRPHPHSPPKATENVSRSRSQSLATGVRPTATERGFMMPLSTLENTGSFPRSYDISPEGPSNMSPFARHLSSLSRESQPRTLPQKRFTQEAFGTPGSKSNYGSAPNTSSLSNSVARALQPAYSTVVGFDPSGGKSGSSSRRHSVSVVGGPGGRRDFNFEGMTHITNPGRGLGPLGLSDEDLLPERLGNALSLEIDQSRRRGVEIEAGRSPLASSLPQSALAPQAQPFEFRPFGATRGRGESIGPSGDRAPSGGSKNSSERSRFSFDTNANPASSMGVGSMPGNMGRGAPNPGIFGIGPTPDRGRDLSSVGAVGGIPPRPMPGAIGGPADPRLFGAPQPYGGLPPSQAMRGGMNFMPTSPVNISAYRPSYGFYNPRPVPSYPPMPPPPGPPQGYYPTPGSPTQPGSPNFSSLSLSDLGKGIPLATIPPTTPLYIVAFKAGRRDVYYCPDPTLLISNGDRVVVEADRGSDLGTVVFDQVTPVDIRDWQEQQATAALLSGASQHQPPGMAQAQAAAAATQHSPTKHRARPSGSGENAILGGLADADLSTLLAGAGTSSQVELSGGPTRGPLAREIMPKRIFAKSSQGPEEQARMMDKLKDEYEALMLCREKVAQRQLPMQIVDAEYQWDRRKLTFYFKADRRVDFRELTKECFRIFKSRIWMSMLPKDDPRN